MTTVNIHCSHPSGVILEDNLGNRVVLRGATWPANGLNPGVGALAAGITVVDAGVWASVSNYHANSVVIQRGVVKQVS